MNLTIKFRRMLSIVLAAAMMVCLSLPITAQAAADKPPFRISGSDNTKCNDSYAAADYLYNGKSSYSNQGIWREDLGYFDPGAGTSIVIWQNNRWELLYNSNQLQYYSTSTSNGINPPTDGWVRENGSTDTDFSLSYGPTFSIQSSAITVDEGAGTVNIPIRVSEDYGYLVTLYYTVTDGSAKSGSDFSAGGVISFNGVSAATTYTLPISITDDDIYEPDETFTVTLTSAQGQAAAGVGGSPCTVTITNNDPQPTAGFTFSTFSAVEDCGTLSIPVRLSNPSSVATTVQYATTNGTAVAGTDYQAISGTLTIPAGSTSANIQIPITDNTVYGDEKNFHLTLSSPTDTTLGTASATITLTDNEPMPTLGFSSADIAVSEGNGTVTLPVSLSGPSASPVTAQYDTADGTATAVADYTGEANGTVTITAGSTTANIIIPLLDDAAYEGDETFSVTLRDITGASAGAILTKTVTIHDDDLLPTTIVTSAALSSDTGSSNSDFITKVSGQTITGNLSATLASGEKVEVSYDNGITWSDAIYIVGSTSWSTQTTLSGSGTFKARVTNANGSSAAYTHTYTFDESAPSAPSAPDMSAGSDSGSSNTDNITNDTTPTFSGTAEPNSSVKLYAGAMEIGSGTADGSGSWTITSSALAEGSHTITAKAEDAAGNISVASSSLNITIDVTAPNPPSTPDMTDGSDSGTSISDNITSDTTPTFTGTAEAGSKVKLYYGATEIGSGTADGSGNWSITSSSLAAGSYTIIATATDAAGNVSAASSGLSITIDTAAPTAPTVTSAATSTNNMRPEWTWTQGDGGNGTYRYKLDNNDLTSGATETATASYTPATVLSDGAHILYVQERDAAGNWSASGSYTVTIDGTAPTVTITSAAPSNTNTSPISITITFNESVTGFDVGDITVGNGTAGNFNGSGTTYTADITPNAQGAVTVDVAANVAQDAAGNNNTAATRLSRTYDNTAPTVTITSAAPTNANTSPISVTFTFSESVTGFVIGDITVGNGTASNFVAVSGTTYTSNITLSAQGTVTVDVAANVVQDAAGNNNTAATQLSRTYDTTAPSAGNTGTIGISELTHNSVKLTWTAATDPGTLAENLQYKVVYSTSNNITTLSDAETNGTAFGSWTANIMTDTVTGLTASTDYYFNVLVKDEAGNMALYSSATGKTTAAPSGGGGAPTTTPAVEVNGQRQDAGTASTTTTGGQTVTTISVDGAKLDKLLETSGEKPKVTLPGSSGSGAVVGELTGQTVKNMETKEATLEIKTETVTYTLPASQINIDAVSSQLGAQVELKDIKVSVKIAEPPADTVKIVEDTASKGNYQIVVKPVTFEITCTSGEQTISVTSFNGYVERTVAIPDGVDPGKITTGIVLNADGTFRHVPTQIVVINGKYYAKINSLTNSTYSVIYSPITFADVSNHWAKDAVNDMGSRMVVTGRGNGVYAPDTSITRAEFATIVVRALGLAQATGESGFSDVSGSDWFNGYVGTATAYGLITGYDSTSYRPNETITREQAMAILERAMKKTGLGVTLTDSEIATLLAAYTDGSSVSGYAKTSVAACLKTGVVNGSSATTLSPKGYVTRAEVAVMVQRLLQQSGLI